MSAADDVAEGWPAGWPVPALPEGPAGAAGEQPVVAITAPAMSRAPQRRRVRVVVSRSTSGFTCPINRSRVSVS